MQVVLQWSDPAATVDVDVSALVLGSDGRVRSDEDLIFYNAPVGADGAVRLVGKTETEDGSEDRVAIDIEALPDSVTQVAIAGSLDAEPGIGFGALQGLTVSVLDVSGEALLRYEIADASSETAFVFGELYLRNGQWKFRAVGQGWDSGLAGLATDYGISVADDSELAADAEQRTGSEHATPAVEAPVEPEPDNVPNTAISAEEEVETLSLGSTDLPVDEIEPTDEYAPVDESEGSTGTDEVSETKSETAKSSNGAGARGVRTRKTPTKPRPVPALTLAGSPTWSAARLFSIYGVGGFDEQEKRATSALLSTVMAVKEFGRSLISRLGGPAGTIETYQEVPFKLGDRTVVPDGVIRVARGAKLWTALLETKTGTNSLKPEQLESYLELARVRGFDAVITLSNEISLLGGEHPAGMDRRKLKKVALQHISWSEVLHEAQMQLSHRGVEDRLQAWMLSELIRYLEHPKSGAAGFEDMGVAWVPIREAIRAGTLRPSNRKINEIIQSWDKLIRHTGMRLTSQLGVLVQPVVSRALANDGAARISAAIASLVADGTMQAVIRIQQAIGPVDIVADLRTNHVRIGLNVEAPREGGASRRVNWLLRQLKDAPDALTIEVFSARKDQTTCELLKDVRESNGPLLPDASADVRSFRLSQTFPLGPKRNGIKGAFIPSVNAAVDAFYGQVVQVLRPWTRPAAKLPAEVTEGANETIEALDDEVDTAGH